MSNTIIQIKRTSANGAPASLEYGELAYSFVSNTLYIGNSSNVPVVATSGAGSSAANAAYAQANSAYAQANAAYNAANSASGAGIAYGQANAAYAQANASYSQANGAYAQANGAYDQANSAYAQANTATTNAGNAYDQANSGYSQANAAYTRANDSYAYANSIYGISNATFGSINTAIGVAYSQANLAYAQANIAYDQANLKLNLTGGVVTGNLTLTSNLIVSNIYTTDPELFLRASKVTFIDPVPHLGVENPTTNDGIDRGFEFRYFDTASRLGFFGWDHSTNEFTGYVHALNNNDSFGGNRINARFFNVTTDSNVSAARANVSQTLNVATRLDTPYVNMGANGNIAGITSSTSNSSDIFAASANALRLAYEQATNAFVKANSAANTVRVSQNSASSLSAKQLNFVNTATVTIAVTDSGDGNANISFVSTGGSSGGDPAAYAQANAAFNQANAAYTQANSAYGVANTANTNALNAYAQANTARNHANAAYAQANTATTNAGNAYNVANNASTDATNAYGQANTARDHANASYSQANTARTHANSAYAQANTAATDALNAYAAANTANTNALNAYGQANSAYGQANAAYTQANTARNTANAAYGQANAAYTQANSAYGQANTAITNAGNAYGKANTAGTDAINAYTQANAAYAKANTPAIYANGTIVVSNTGNINFNNTASINVAASANGIQSNLSFVVNTSSITSVGTLTQLNVTNNVNAATINAATVVNTGSGINVFSQATSAYTDANTANTNAKNAYGQANTAYGQANAAYGAANTAANTARVSANAGSTVSGRSVRFNNTASILVSVAADPSDTTNVNVSFTTSGASAGAAYDQANNAYAAANSAANTARVSANSGSTVSARSVNFVNTATVLVDVAANPSDSSNVNVSFTAIEATANFASIASATGDVHGIISRTASTLSFNDSTRQFTIAPVSGSWTFYHKGTLHTISTSLSITIANTSGARFIRIDPTTDTLVEGGSVPDFKNDTIVAYIYYNAATGKGLILGDERHGFERDTTWHSNQHLNVGTVWRSGGALTYTLADDTAVTVGVGTPLLIADEDLLHTITNSASPTADYEQILSTSASLEVLYLDGNGYYANTTPSTTPWVAGTSRAVYNSVSAGLGSLVDATEGEYITYWLIATNDIRRPVKLVMGRASHASIDDAYAEEFTEYGLSFAEQVFMYQIVLQTSTAFTNNTPKVEIAAVRKVLSKVASSASIVSAASHGGLTGRDSADQHPTSAITGLDALLGNIYAAANSAANTARVSANGGSTVSGRSVRFNNTASILVSVAADPTDTTNINVSFTTSGASAGAAYDQANNAYAQANSAYAKANTPAVYANGTIVVSNTGNVNFNNTASINVAASANGSQSNIAFTVNTTSITSVGTLTQLNVTNNVNAATINASTVVNTGSGINVFAQAVSAYTDANTANTNAKNAYDRANSAYDRANASYAHANTIYDQANTARNTANAAYGQANAAYGQANTAYGQANAAYGQANAAYGTANTANTNALNAYGQANTARNHANAAYDQANTATTNAGNAYDQANTAITNAGNAYDQANTARSTANGAYAHANIIYGQANTARNHANAAYDQANTARDTGNGAYAQANAVYAAANTAANTVRVYANGASVISKANLNFNNTATINVSVTANGSTQANIAFSVNASAVGGGSGSGNANITVSDTAPSTPTANTDLWWQANTGSLKIYYNDGTSSQWVDASIPLASSPGAGGGAGVPGGSNTYVQINDDGFLGGSSGFTFNKANNMVAVTSGNVKMMGTSGLMFGGSTEGDPKFKIVFNSSTNSLDFLYTG